jgi:hypothetical protein
MNPTSRLPAQLQRLYGLPAEGADPTRVLVLSLGRPADWLRVGQVWQAVQTELHLPAPAIAVNGVDAFQLWFSLALPRPVAEVRAFAQGVRARWLADLAPQRLTLWPDRADSQPAPQIPAVWEPDSVWSAFVAADLAPVFADTPWLDIPPNLDGQADLLSKLSPISPTQWQHACALLRPPEAVSPPVGAVAASSEPVGPQQAFTDPRQFLLAVMNDERVDLALRIEAARALLP